MDAEEALLELDEWLSRGHEGKYSSEDLQRYAAAVVEAATISEGYTKAAWKGGANLLRIAETMGVDRVGMFDSFGWLALANGLRAGLSNKHILRALSYADENFLPPANMTGIFKHTLVLQALEDGFRVTPRPFIAPSELAATTSAVQAQFCCLLNSLDTTSADLELRLQWSTCALRVLSSNDAAHQEASVSFLQSLLDGQRYLVAYYAFRALADQHEDLWRESLATEILQLFVGYCLDRADGHMPLVQLCTDPDLLRKCHGQSAIPVLLGTLGIHLVRDLGHQEGEDIAWLFINELYNTYSLLAYALSSYLNSGELPTLPAQYAQRIEQNRSAFRESLRIAERELRQRTYDDVTLAIKIYQDNVQDTFRPILEEAQSGHISEQFLNQMKQIDPAELVTENNLQRTNRFPIQGTLLRKMIADNRKILQALESAAKTRMKLDELLSDLAAQSTEQFGLYHEFKAACDDLGQPFQWALETLVPNLLQRLKTGLEITRQEEAIIHATRLG